MVFFRRNEGFVLLCNCEECNVYTVFCGGIWDLEGTKSTCKSSNCNVWELRYVKKKRIDKQTLF